jgi:hypothetical protein
VSRGQKTYNLRGGERGKIWGRFGDFVGGDGVVNGLHGGICRFLGKRVKGRFVK